MLCEACQKIFRGRQVLSNDPTEYDNGKQAPHVDTQTTHHHSMQSFLEAADSGCPICYELRHSLGESRMEIFSGMSTTNEFSLWELLPKEGKGYDISLELHDDYDDIIEERFDLTLEVLPHSVYGGPLVNNSESAGDSTTSDSAWAQAFKWYHECLSTHTACNSRQNLRHHGNYLPSRLLSLSEEDQGIIRLIITEVEREGIDCYSTLSHCWGGADILKLETSTLDTFQQGISLELLPKTFVEAIAVSRRLSIPYLWIDSLCIIQDSVSDWQVEAASMEDVYSNSRLNIMATASRNSHEGLFRSRDPKHLALCTVESQWTDAANDRFHIVEEQMWETEMTDAPLNQRGWVLQERILPPRALHYGQHQLLWECRELDACEKYPTGLPKFFCNMFTGVKITDPEAYRRYENDWWRFYKYRDSNNADEKDRIEAELGPASHAYKLWTRWIQVYSSMQLTRYSDRLIAFSGLSNRIQAVLQDEYVAGLWRSRFVDELLWYTFGNSSTEVESESYRPVDSGVPTWSWASLSGPVVASSTHHVTGKVYHVDLKGVKVKSVSGREGDGNNHGTDTLSDGQVRLRGFLKRAYLIKKVYHMPEEDYEAPSIVMSVEVDGAKMEALVCVDEPMLGLNRMAIFVLPVLTYTRDPSSTNPELPQLNALLLKKAAKSPGGFYSRVGYVSGIEEHFSGAELRGFFHNQRAVGHIQEKKISSMGFRNALRKLTRVKEPGGSAGSWPKLGDKKLYLSEAYGDLIIV